MTATSSAPLLEHLPLRIRLLPLIILTILIQALQATSPVSYPSRSVTIDRKPLDSPPVNILLIVSDDAGYQDFGFTGGTGKIRTPALDRLASEGVIFNQAYVTASVCCPSRMGLITGRYQQRFGAECNVPRIPTPGYSVHDLGLDLKEQTMGDHMKQAGYRTLMAGKWHLGSQDSFHPSNRGFDIFHGFLGGSRSYRPLLNPSHDQALYHNRNIIHEGNSVTYLTDDLTTAAITFMKESQRRPFFIFLSYNAVHTPMEARDEDLDRLPEDLQGRRRLYAAMTHSMDNNVGRLMEFLDDNNLSQHTLVAFVNDNGGATNNASQNAPLRGFKGSYFEGGIRVPLVMRWPGTLPANRHYDLPVSTLDLLPTFIAAAGGSQPTAELDGKNLIPYITDNTRDDAPHDYLFWRLWRAAAARSGKWKLIRIAENPLKSDRKLLSPLILFNLESDPYEQSNVAEVFPQVTTHLLTKLEQWETKLVPPRWYDGTRWQHWAQMQVHNHRMTP